jgi:hypothetical protein
MVTKQSIYLDEKAQASWDLILRDERNESIKEFLNQYASKMEGGQRSQDIRRLELEIGQLTEQSSIIQTKLETKGNRLEQLRGDDEMLEVDLENEWLELERCARAAQVAGDIWQSYAGRADYRVHSAGMGRVYIENIATGRTTSNFQKGTFILGMQRLLDAGGRLKKLNMIPVKMHEYCVVNLSPNLSIQGDYIVYRGDS